MKAKPAEIIEEFGPFPNASQINGVSYDGKHVWFSSGDHVSSLDPATGEIARNLDVPGHAGTAFDGRYLFQIAESVIHKVDPATGTVVSTIPAPGGGNDSGMAWADGSLWVGQYQDRKIHQIDPETGDIQRTIETRRVVTGVTWVDGDLWHGIWEDEETGLNRIDPQSGDVLEALELPQGIGVSGLESNGADRFFCGGGRSGKIRVVRRPEKVS